MSKKCGVKTTMTKPLLSPLMSSASLSAAYAQGSKEGRDNAFFLILPERGLEDRDIRRIMDITQEASALHKIQDSLT